MLCIAFTLSRPDAQDAPLVVVFNGMPLFERLVDAIHQVDHEVPKETIAARLSKQGVSDKTLTQMSVQLTVARQAGEWPSIEIRMDDGELINFQLLTFHDVMTQKQKLDFVRKRRAAKKN